MKRNIILVGGFPETIELCELCDLNIVGIIDNKINDSIMGYSVIGKDEDAKKLFSQFENAECVITPDNPQLREKLYNYYKGIGYKIGSVISPHAYISQSAVIGEGSIIQSFCNVSTNCRIGRLVKLNTYANVMHDVSIDDFATIAPNAVCLGYVKIGKKAYIGSNSTIIQNNNIGEGVVVGAGAVVTKDIVDNDIVVGVPAKTMNKEEIIK